MHTLVSGELSFGPASGLLASEHVPHKALAFTASSSVLSKITEDKNDMLFLHTPFKANGLVTL